MESLYLIGGLTAVFAGLAIAMASATAMNRQRSQVAHSLATIQGVSAVPSEMIDQLDPSFSQRVGQPTRTALIAMGRRLTPTDWHERARRRLDLAGNPPGWDSERVLAAKSGAAILLGGGSTLLLLMNGSVGAGLLWGAGLTAFGFFLPDILLKNAAQKRSQRIRRDLPDAVDLLGISVESGLAFDAALAQVAKNTDGPVAAEFTRVLQEMQIGKSRGEALRAMADRTDVDEMRIFLAALVQAEKLGIPIVEVLRVQTSEMRLKRSQRAEEQAQKLPVKILFPVMFGILPAIFVVIMGPAVIRIIDAFS
jgi:tight adherence protein C